MSPKAFVSQLTPDDVAEQLLADGTWRAVTDKTRQRMYYFNVATKERVWNLAAHVEKLGLHVQGGATSSAAAPAVAARPANATVAPPPTETPSKSTLAATTSAAVAVPPLPAAPNGTARGKDTLITVVSSPPPAAAATKAVAPPTAAVQLQHVLMMPKLPFLNRCELIRHLSAAHLKQSLQEGVDMKLKKSPAAAAAGDVVTTLSISHRHVDPAGGHHTPRMLDKKSQQHASLATTAAVSFLSSPATTAAAHNMCSSSTTTITPAALSRTHLVGEELADAVIRLSFRNSICRRVIVGGRGETSSDEAVKPLFPQTVVLGKFRRLQELAREKPVDMWTEGCFVVKGTEEGVRVDLLEGDERDEEEKRRVPDDHRPAQYPLKASPSTATNSAKSKLGNDTTSAMQHHGLALMMLSPMEGDEGGVEAIPCWALLSQPASAATMTKTPGSTPSPVPGSAWDVVGVFVVPPVPPHGQCTPWVWMTFPGSTPSGSSQYGGIPVVHESRVLDSGNVEHRNQRQWLRQLHRDVLRVQRDWLQRILLPLHTTENSEEEGTSTPSIDTQRPPRTTGDALLQSMLYRECTMHRDIRQHPPSVAMLSPKPDWRRDPSPPPSPSTITAGATPVVRRADVVTPHTDTVSNFTRRWLRHHPDGFDAVQHRLHRRLTEGRPAVSTIPAETVKDVRFGERLLFGADDGDGKDRQGTTRLKMVKHRRDHHHAVEDDMRDIEDILSKLEASALDAYK